MVLRRKILEIPDHLTQAELWELVGRKETGLVDFKEQLPKPAKLQEPLVALANHRGGAVIVGVSKNRPHTVLGTAWDQSDDEKVQEAVRAMQPPVAVDVAIADVDGKTIVALQVEEIEQGWTHTSDGRLLIRSGPTNRVLVGRELARFVRERSMDPVEDEIVSGANLADLDNKLLSRYLAARISKRMPKERALKGLGWVDDNGRLRLAAFLVFGKAPQRANRRFGIEILRFEGGINGPARLRDRRDLEGSLPTLVEKADRVIYDEMRRDAVVRGLVREEVPEFPPVVIREALVNAVVHRDYTARGSAVQVRMYDDALEIESPGTLPGYVTVETLREAQYSRNERIMDAFQRLGLVEEAGQGIDRMVAEMEDALLDPPEFEERNASFVVRLKGTSVFSAEDRLWAGQFSDFGLSPDARVALVYARRHGAISNEDLRRLRSLDREKSRSVLQELVARGLLAQVGKGRGSRYVLGPVADRARISPSVAHQLQVVLAYAKRQGIVVNSDVRGLLDVERVEARAILYDLVGRGLLEAVGERRGRRYLPVDAASDPPELALLDPDK